MNDDYITTFSDEKKDIHSLQGKNVLLIANRGYARYIREELSSLGANCFYINDKPNDGLFAKAFGRLKFKPYINLILNKYYSKQIDSIPDEIDRVLCIRGEYTPISALIKIKKKYPSAKTILYMWDSIANNKGIEEKWKYYDEVWTFDRKDYANNVNHLKFLPLFYYEKLMNEEIKSNVIKYDLSFIGTGHGDRCAIIKSIEKQCTKSNLNFYYYIYIPHILVYILNKLFNKSFRGIHISDVHFKGLPFEETYNIYRSSKCILDVESSKQNGLTMRTIEVLGLKRKIVTTNKDVINYDFYNDHNVFIAERDNISIDSMFMNREYEELPKEIYEKYSLKSWLIELLGGD